ncbi:MAG: DUF1538 domain-containing protein [Candidatus Methanoperedens sp.]|nr:DUF1538 domain-containing protein [Candidatus Methanoperedens sp.]
MLRLFSNFTIGGKDPITDSFGLVATATLAPVISLLILGIAMREEKGKR